MNDTPYHLQYTKTVNISGPAKSKQYEVDNQVYEVIIIMLVPARERSHRPLRQTNGI